MATWLTAVLVVMGFAAVGFKVWLQWPRRRVGRQWGRISIPIKRRPKE